MPRFNFFDIRQPSVEGAYGQALQGELARAESQGAWARALERAVEVANARNDRREQLRAEMQMRRELAAMSQAGETQRAMLQEAGQEARSKRFLASQQAAQAENVRQFNMERAAKDAAIAREQAGQAAFGALTTGQIPMMQPPQHIMGAPPQVSTLDKAQLLAQLPPPLAAQYMLNERQDHELEMERLKHAADFGFRQTQHADEVRLKEHALAIDEANQARLTEADAASKRKSLYERAVEIASKMPNLKKKQLGADGISEESDDAYQARFDAQVQKIMGQIGDEQTRAQIAQDPYGALDMGSAASAATAPDATTAPNAPGSTQAGGTTLYGKSLDAQQAAFLRGDVAFGDTPLGQAWNWITGKGGKPANATPRMEIVKRAQELIRAGKKEEAGKLLSSIGINTAAEVQAALAGQ